MPDHKKRGADVSDWQKPGAFRWAGGGVSSTGVGGAAVAAFRPNGVDLDAWLIAQNCAGKLGAVVEDYRPDEVVDEL